MDAEKPDLAPILSPDLAPILSLELHGEVLAVQPKVRVQREKC